MNELQKLVQDIEKLRDKLQMLIEQHGDLQHPDILSASQTLNAAIVKYTEIVEKAMKK